MLADERYAEMESLLIKTLNLQDKSEKLKFIENDDVKMDSAQSSSNKFKNYFLKIYSQHINFLNTI